jgi:hypothetical protein
VDIDQIGHRDIYRANPYTYYFKNEDGTSVVYDNRYYSKIVFVNPIILTNKNNCTLDCSNFTGPLHGNTTPPTVDFQYDANGDLLSMEIIDYGDSIEFDEIFLHDGTVPGTEYTISVFISVPRGEKVTMDEIATTSEVKAKQDAFVDYPSSSKGSLGDLPGMIAISSSHIYYCVAEYDGVTDIWARVALTTETW